MKITYDDSSDLLYLRFDEREQAVQNRALNDDMVLDIGHDGKIVGLEILDASKHVDLQILLTTPCHIST